MWDGKKVSVIFPTYNEKDSIREAIEDFFASGYVDEVVVVNNNAAEGTDEEVSRTKARLVYETQQGYGHAIQKGLSEEQRGDNCDSGGKRHYSRRIDPGKTIDPALGRRLLGLGFLYQLDHAADGIVG